MLDITESPFKSVSILYRKTHIWLNRACARFGLTGAQALTILIVCDFEALTQDEITKRLSLDKSVIAKTVSKLVDAGFLRRSVNPKDRRTYDIRPTDRSWEVYPLIKEQVRLCFDRVTQTMSDDERVEFARRLSLAAKAAISQEG